MLRAVGPVPQETVDEWERENHIKQCPACRGVPNSLPCVNDPEYQTKVQRIAAGLPERGLGKTFSTYLSNSREQKIALIEAQKYAELPDRKWMLLLGPKGTGKTHLALAIAEERIAKGQPVLYSKVPKFLMSLRSKISGATAYQQLFDRWTECPMIILDDLGQENDSDWTKEALMLLLDTRYELKIPTVITSNLDNEGFMEKYGPALHDRLTDSQTGTIKQVICNWTSYRQN
jgi:DNA replication protein DnaC